MLAKSASAIRIGRDMLPPDVQSSEHSSGGRFSQGVALRSATRKPKDRERTHPVGVAPQAPSPWASGRPSASSGSSSRTLRPHLATVVFALTSGGVAVPLLHCAPVLPGLAPGPLACPGLTDPIKAGEREESVGISLPTHYSLLAL